MSSRPVALFCPSPATERGRSTKVAAFKDDRIVYTNGRGVFIRSLTDPGASVSYFGHVREATVARVSPSGSYVASGDVTGAVRIWDVAGTDQILKNEVRPIAGRINDLAWDGESKRIIAVGDGKERFGHAFSFDTGSSVGEIVGHSKVVNAVAMRSSRPFRAATASDDGSVVFLHGAPYKFAKVIRSHSSFVHTLDYSLSGSHFASGSADRLIHLYDGSTGDVLNASGLTGHEGGIYAVSFSPDGNTLASSSGDQTVRTWDVEAGKETGKWSLDAQQVGGCHVGDRIVSLSLNGDVNVVDKRQAGKTAQTLYGHQKAITALSYSHQDSGTFFSGSYDGRVNSFASTGECTPVAGVGHANQVLALSGEGPGLVSVGMDDSFREIDVAAKSFKSGAASTGSLPKDVACDSNGTGFLATVKEIQVISPGGKKEASLPVDYSPLSVAYSSKAQVAVGAQDGQIRLYSKDLQVSGTLDKSRSAVTALAFSPDGSLLAAGEASGKILVYDVASKEIKISHWVFHTGRIASIKFSPDGQFAVSGSLDESVYVWSVAKPAKKVAIKNTHAGGVNAVAWVSDKRIASAGADSSIRVFDITLPA